MEWEELQPFPQPLKWAQLTPQSKHFRDFRRKWSGQESARVVRLAFSPVAPHRLAVVSGTKVGIWQSGIGGEATNDVNLSKFKDVTQCVAWRNDGKLILVGDAAGNCSVIEAEAKKSLRRLRGHGDAVTCASFASADRTRAATGGRDGRLRTWDVATGELLQTTDAHADCMKVLASGAGGPDAWVTAGLDGKVRLWDLRASDGACAMTVDHGHPVEDGVPFPGGASFVAAGGAGVKVWDFAAGGRALQAMENAHTKAVTAVCLDSQASVLLTVSFDGLAKLWHAADLSIIRSLRLEAPATCATWRPDDKGYAVGMDDGHWQMRQYRPPREEWLVIQEAIAKAHPKPKVKGELRGIDAEPMADDEVVELPKRKRQKEGCGRQVEYFLRKFEYKKLIEYMVDHRTDLQVGFAIIDELIQRDALATALDKLGEQLCLDALCWFTKAFAMGDALQHHLFEEALHTLFDRNMCLNPPNNSELTDAIARLTDKMSQELKVQEVIMETSGMFKSIMLI